MGKIHDAPAMPDARGPVRPCDEAPELETAIEAEAKAAADAVRARRRVDALLAAAHRSPSDAASTSDAHMTRAEYARRSRVSEATVSRWLVEGMPSMPVGTTVRIVPADADEWRRARGRRPTKSAPRTTADETDVESVLSRAGLRAMGGGRR